MNYDREIFEARDDFMDALYEASNPGLDALMDMAAEDCDHPCAYTVYSREEPLYDYCPDCCRQLI